MQQTMDTVIFLIHLYFTMDFYMYLSLMYSDVYTLYYGLYTIDLISIISVRLSVLWLDCFKLKYIIRHS